MKNVLVIDGFYKDPQKVREVALACDWIDPSSLSNEFPGTESKRCFYSRQLVEKLGSLIGGNVDPEPHRRSFGAFALALDADREKKVVHVDSCDWTGIVYLTLDRDAQGGTTLFYHKRTQLNRFPTDSELERLSYPTKRSFEEDVLVKDGKNFNAWESDIKIDMRFNRLVLFRGGHLFHAADSYFGETPQNGRLTQLFFFRERSQ